MRQLAAILIFATMGATFASSNPPFEQTLSAARAGNPGAQYKTGMAYLLGQGTPRDIPQAVRWLRPAAAAGVPQALVALAGLYDVGCGVPLAVDHAVELRQQAARAGNQTAIGQLAEDRDIPGNRDFRRASVLADIGLFSSAYPYALRAASAGSSNANLMLGYFHEYGRVVRRDHRMALVYYDRAAAAGNRIAQRAAANLRTAVYSVPARGASGSQSPDFQAFQCNGAGGYWNGSLCTITK